MSFIVAIDGPAGSGKGTVASGLAKKYKLHNIDTGAMYRCIALETINNNVNVDEIEKIIELLPSIKIELMEEKGKQIFLLNGKDVSEEIRTIKVTKIVSQISAIKEVRQKLLDLQRQFAKSNDIIMEGRDITTVIFPNADVKIYLDADLEIRAKRRYDQNKEKNIKSSYEEVLTDMQKRDENDKNKPYGALKIAEGAIVIDSTNMTKTQVIHNIGEIIKDRKSVV